VPTIRALADSYVESLARLDPVWATGAGVRGHEHALTDYSPAGSDERAQLRRRTLRALDDADTAADSDRVAVAVMRERLRTALDVHEAEEHLRALRVIASPLQGIRQVFDLMAYETDDDWEAAAARMAAVPGALDGFAATLREGAQRGVVAARRQVTECARQAATWGGLDPSTPPFFPALAARHAGAAPLHDRLVAAAAAATDAYVATSRFLTDEYAPLAGERDGVGRDRYALMARTFTGAALDLDETYAWGWDELLRIEAAMRATAERILPGASIDAATEHLEHDASRTIDGEAEFRAWNQELIDTTIRELDGRHFDIAPPLHRCEAMIAPPGGAAAMYYTPPSEDFTRPGRTWYPTLGRTRFPLWREVSTCYHEAAPGHHLQVGHVMHRADVLTRFQRVTFVSGHGEGWALYAERLMGELGALDDPAWEMGMLAAQAMRAVRIVVDIGLHLGLRVPDGAVDGATGAWTPELALEFVVGRSRFPRDFMASEVDRYLGWPGQAISYKVGERVWLEAREAARARHGAAFDLRAFHAHALDLGSMGLDPLRDELARF
jgi:uncharacterized protein (DUF885 family)